MAGLRCGVRAAVTAAALLAGGVSAASTESIFSTFDAGDGFDASVYTPVNFYTDPEVIGTNLAFAFSVPAGLGSVLDAIEVAASWAGSKKNALFAVFGDSGGLPATDPLLILAENPPALAEAVPGIVSLPAPARLVLEPGATYWFAVAPASLDATVPANDFVQLWLNLDQRVTQTVRNSFDAGPWGDWFSPAIEV